ncbi:MAG: hypothetical protein LBK54_10355 [Propionibacteriaceae bacterium]|jgi:hypothetical protein|nr:hypothetical protein [Propionibacteriaceae bacterium]
MKVSYYVDLDIGEVREKISGSRLADLVSIDPVGFLFVNAKTAIDTLSQLVTKDDVREVLSCPVFDDDDVVPRADDDPEFLDLSAFVSVTTSAA